MRGATHCAVQPGLRAFYFNPRSPCGERPNLSETDRKTVEFQSTLPMRGATADFIVAHPTSRDFNPRSPCGERQREFCKNLQAANFNPRSPCGERLLGAAQRVRVERFQSTLPMRGATNMQITIKALNLISIHAPHAGSDSRVRLLSRFLADFNPRSPCGERLVLACSFLRAVNFNPRSPCGERPLIA